MPTMLVRRAVISLRDLGLRRSLETVANQLADLWFDAANGTDTYRRVQQSELRVLGANQDDAAPYFPTRGRAFRKALEAFQVPREGTLVDLGSGKGKILLLAAQLGYRRVRGIEFSPDLARIADANIERMRGKLGQADVRTICADVTTYDFAPDENVFFMFAPFGPAVMRRMMLNLQESLAKHPRHIWLIYSVPNLPASHPLRKGLDLLATHLDVTRAATFTYGGHEFVLLTG